MGIVAPPGSPLHPPLSSSSVAKVAERRRRRRWKVVQQKIEAEWRLRRRSPNKIDFPLQDAIGRSFLAESQVDLKHLKWEV